MKSSEHGVIQPKCDSLRSISLLSPSIDRNMSKGFSSASPIFDVGYYASLPVTNLPTEDMEKTFRMV